MANYHQPVGRGECRAKCPQGNRCTCSDKAHTLHVCGDETCACHGQERYQREVSETTEVAYERTTYRGGGVRVVHDRRSPGGVGWIEVERP